MIKKGDIIEIDLVDIANGGDCIGRYQGLAVFVPGGVPGERISARVIEKKKSYARAELLEVIKEVKTRVNPECPVFGACGGCQLQHIDYKEQLKYKEKMVRDLLERVAKLDEVNVQPTIGAEYPFAYRNKAQFPLTRNQEGNIVTGFFKRGTHQVVAHNDCHIQHPLINKIADKTLEILNKFNISVYDEKMHKGLLRHLLVRVGVCTNQGLLTIITSRSSLPYQNEISDEIMKEIPEIVGVIQNINREKTNVIMGKKIKLLAGQDHYIDYIGNIKYAVTYRSFFQVNTLQTKILYDTIHQFANLTGQEVIVDAYCGIGSISLYLAKEAKKVIGIEVISEAIEDAEKNVDLNGINNCSFITGSVEKELPLLLKKGIRPDLVIFDPPRKGLDQDVIKSVLKVKPTKLIYVSCNPATLARDIGLFKDEYLVKKVQPVDMFPNTYHVESVVLMELKK